jgi:hypothetical protein
MATTLASSNASQFLVPQYLGASRQELERLHRELEREDAILLTMAQRIPELVSSIRATRIPSDALGAAGWRYIAYPQNGGAEKASWWRRFFGLE